jgi:hypothetical protein
LIRKKKSGNTRKIFIQLSEQEKKEALPQGKEEATFSAWSSSADRDEQLCKLMHRGQGKLGIGSTRAVSSNLGPSVSIGIPSKGTRM